VCVCVCACACSDVSFCCMYTHALARALNTQRFDFYCVNKRCAILGLLVLYFLRKKICHVCCSLMEMNHCIMHPKHKLS